MKVHIYDPKNIVGSIRRGYVFVFDSAGFGDIPDTKPHVSITHISKRMKPDSLQKSMEDVVTWQENEKVEKDGLSRFKRKHHYKLIKSRRTNRYVATRMWQTQ